MCLESVYGCITVRNKDLTWPEELSQMAKNKAVLEKGTVLCLENLAVKHLVVC